MTISTERLTNAELRQIIDSHEKSHGMCVPVNYGYIAAKELLAVREAQSVPVAGACEQEVYERGKSACMVDIPKHMAEEICRSLSLATGFRIDWHYFGGRVHIKVLAPPAPAVPDERLLFETLIEKEFGDLIDRSHVKNGGGGYFAWDMQVAWRAWQGRAAMLQSCDTVRDLSTPVDPQIAEYEQSVLRLSGNSEHVSQGYTFDGLNIRAVAALRESVRNQWLKSEEFADKIYWKNMHSIANEIIEAMAAAPTPTK